MIRRTSVSDPRRKAAPGPKESMCSQVGKAVKSQDMFSEQFSLRIDDGDDSIKTGFGTFCSLILFVVTALYAGMKMNVLQARNDVNILQATKDLYFSDSDVFSY